MQPETLWHVQMSIIRAAKSSGILKAEDSYIFYIEMKRFQRQRCLKDNIWK
jgi:hypothetical protein